MTVQYSRIDGAETDVRFDGRWIGTLLAIKENGRVNPRGLWRAGSYLYGHLPELKDEVFDCEEAARAAVEAAIERKEATQ